MDTQIVATIVVLAAIVFLVVQHLAVMRIAHHRDRLHDTVVAIAKGEATATLKANGEVEIRGVS